MEVLEKQALIRLDLHHSLFLRKDTEGVRPFAGIDPGFQIINGMRRSSLEEKVVRTYFEENLESIEPLIRLMGLDKAFRLMKDALSRERHSFYLNPLPLSVQAEIWARMPK